MYESILKFICKFLAAKIEERVCTALSGGVILSNLFRRSLKTFFPKIVGKILAVFLPGSYVTELSVFCPPAVRHAEDHPGGAETHPVLRLP